MKKLWFVTGTDTGVGKTVCAMGLIRALRATGAKVCGCKPFSSGSSPESLPADAALLEEAAESGERGDLLAPVRFSAALAPLAAARAASGEVDVERAASALDDLIDRYDAVVAEGIGGVRVPLRPGFDLLHFMARWQPHTLVAARPGLGTLNHTTLTVEALQGVRIPVRAVVLSCGTETSEDLSVETNPGLLAEGLDLPVHTLPWLGPRVHVGNLPKQPFARILETART